jgi:hypothetical protein
MKTPKKFRSEAELCAAFIRWAESKGWKSYPETAGWDILLVGSDGCQIGIQAKLRFNAKVLTQVLDSDRIGVGPDHRAILIPMQNQDGSGICHHLKVACFYPSNWVEGEFFPSFEYAKKYDWNPTRRHDLPEYVPDVIAGASSPIQLTAWKIKALRVCALLERHGTVSSRQISDLGMDTGRWTNPTTGWLKPVHLKRGMYTRGDNLCFDKQHPKVYAEILGETGVES